MRTEAAESPPPTTEKEPLFSVASIIACATPAVPLEKASISKTPIGPFQKTVLEEASISQDILDTPAQDLSGGQQQRVGIARVLLMGSPVLLLDEPTASLDVETSNKFCQTLKQLKGGPAAKDGKKRTFLMITHRLEEAKFLADKILMIEAGHIVEYTDCETFFTHPQTQRAAEFLKAQAL